MTRRQPCIPLLTEQIFIEDLIYTRCSERKQILPALHGDWLGSKCESKDRPRSECRFPPVMGAAERQGLAS